jgi:hypothetical protein
MLSVTEDRFTAVLALAVLALDAEGDADELELLDEEQPAAASPVIATTAAAAAARRDEWKK